MDLSRRKLEFGCGHRPTPGYIANDINPFEGVEIVGNPWEISLPDGSLDEIIALGLMEHLTNEQFDRTLANAYRLLASGGTFLFDVPDIPVWCGYIVDHFAGKPIPFTIEHCFNTLYGWQRWPGDEHKSGWYREKLEAALLRNGFTTFDYNVEYFISRGLTRNRMTRPHDAHLYCRAQR
ncbi:methyltransferase domain-containing protein [uncultured Methylobacterium sp.]|jgi:predicted SAM-dependent methyltransferase|uniref:class I SAM-dependent methyltransferase n=1 Tax=uncultured Methylobacterium sp. TaxID=157278 RepID=UPI002619E6C1|nr:methyltransferase domain-containing protein [uncultured Methylobacterium sp.]